jgi:FlaA1/EpsC-like NDP-sugar epimerase
LVVGLDIVIMMTSILLSYILVYDFRIGLIDWNTCIQMMIGYTVIMVPGLVLKRIYNRLWSYASIGDLLSILRGIALGAGMVWSVNLIIYLVSGRIYAPFSVWFIAPLLTFLGIAGSRFVWRLLSDGYAGRKANKIRTLIVGAGEAGYIVARALRREQSRYYPVAFIDDNVNKLHQNLAGIPVVGTRHDIPEVVKQYDIDEIILALPSAKRQEITKIINICKTTDCKIKLIPGVNDMVNGEFTVSVLRNVDVEDLLGREPVRLNLQEIASYLEGKVVLVTGAGGSIGSELCRQVIRFHPKRLILLGRGENSVYEIEHELRAMIPSDTELIPVIADIQDYGRVANVFKTHRPDVIFHAAAHKHVPLMEMHPIEAVKNNILGTYNLVVLADMYQAERFVMISTDKAVNPTNVMGASKRAAELIVQSRSRFSRTRFATVRFGNVLGSRGSVIPLFRKQIEAGGPVTVTHPKMVRYFMTIPEAVQLVIQAGALSEGGETFVLDMGEPVKIIDLARDLIRLSGFSEKEIPIQISGIRPGEKLYEELLTKEEGTMKTVHDRIFIARSEYLAEEELAEMIASFRTLAEHQDGVQDEEIRRLLKRWVPTYMPNPGQLHLTMSNILHSEVKNTKNINLQIASSMAE